MKWLASYIYQFEEGYPSMPETAGNKALLRELNEVNHDLGIDIMEPLDPARRGAGDLSFVAPMSPASPAFAHTVTARTPLARASTWNVNPSKPPASRFISTNSPGPEQLNK